MTSALPYANGPIHIGHVAGAYLPGDIRARYERLAGNDVLWVCGSDEHGAAITLRAKKDGLTPRDIVDRYHGEMQHAFEGLDLSFDHYSRTSSPKHHQNAQDFFKTLLDKGSFEVKTEAQFYDPEAQQFLADRYIIGTCPKCTADGAYGDQCEKCGSALSPNDLIQPKSTLSGATPILKDTTLWYLPMGRHEGWLKDYIEKGLFEGQPHHDPQTWKAHVTGQCRSWIDGGLQSRAMTRDLDWGVSVPVEGAEGKVVDFDLLKQELSHAVVEGNKERYRLEWPGKRQAIVTANLPTTKTLRPVREDSVDFDNTENLYIEGDNLEVLKLLQESYLGKIKMIYIDPPYNTGKDFVYKDNFSKDVQEELIESGQKDEFSQRLIANPETAGRYHSDWLSMMYPRLKLARNLLSKDGAIFISVDDNELSNLKKVCKILCTRSAYYEKTSMQNVWMGL